MQRIDFQASALVSMPGCAEVVAGVLEERSIDLGSIEYQIPDGICYNITLSNIGDAIVASGSASATVQAECSRCLEPASIFVESDIEGYFTLSEESDTEGLEDDEFDIIPDDGVIDLASIVVAAIIVEIPPIFLCQDDCKGLCSKCGCNLNEETCGCVDEIDDSNPFAVLKDFKFE